MTDAEELAQLREMRRALTKDPEIRKKFQRVIKEAIPSAPTPDLDQEEALNKRLSDERKELQDRIEKLESERLKAELESRYNGERSRLAGPPYNFDEEDIAEVEKLIKDKEFPSYALAADYYKATTTPSRPSGLGIGGSQRSKSIRQSRKEFNDKFKGVFKGNKNSSYQSTFDDAYAKVMSGDYLKE
jgi:hypothetical protein